MKQKFFRGQRVRLAKDFGESMSHFGGKGGEAIVVYSYADQYGGGDHSSFGLLLLSGKPDTLDEYPNQCAWYYDHQMTLISDDRATGEKVLQMYNEFLDEHGDDESYPVVDSRGKLLPYFVCVSNMAARDRAVVVRGNERVLKARLSDAAFFYQEDLKVSLEKRVEQLKKVVYQAKLGTSYVKMMRFRALALILVEKVDPSLRETVERTSCSARRTW